MPLLDKKMGIEAEIAEQIWGDFIATCWKEGEVFCIKCKNKEYYKLARNRYRCKVCSYTFHDFSGRWINKININLHKWALLISLFCKDSSVSNTARNLKISYPTIFKAYNVIRLSIAQKSADWKSLKKIVLCTNESKNLDIKQNPIFGITEKKGRVSTFYLENISLKLLTTSGIKIYNSNQVFYTNKFKKYDYLLFYMSKNCGIASKSHIIVKQIPQQDDFKSYLLEKLKELHGIDDNRFPLYLKEMEFKFNRRPPPNLYTLNELNLAINRQRQLIKRLIGYLTNFSDF